ncbi:hypothetical protein HPB52_003409 [Rhipicephalus sanguineus]|uniref:Uncharacterized protein n=1 Tax=Rhipicephalus sanguineus TaxID=34632 RepID=A0A9D4SU80_RHISA|nr:hypothetical protein HPB52_003409 [Rhipicephalus sanguineus]
MPDALPLYSNGLWLVGGTLLLFIGLASDSVSAQVEYDAQDADETTFVILAGWYDISRLLVSFLVSKPKNADIIYAMVSTNALNVDFIGLMDKFWAQQPSVFFFTLLSICYMVALAVGAPLYFWARSRDMMGGDRTQDINEGYKFVLQALTIAFVICIAIVGLTLVITVLTVFLQAPLVTGQRTGLFGDLRSVATYARDVGQELQNLTDTQAKLLRRIQKATEPSHLVEVIYEFFLPQVESSTSYMSIDSAQRLHVLAELAQKHSRVSSMLRAVDALKADLQKKITKFIATNFVEKYNAEITLALNEVPKALNLITRTAKDIKDDLDTFLKSLKVFVSRFNDGSRESLTALFGTRFLIYGSASALVCGVLVLFFSVSFLVGVSTHDDTIAPTKRSETSERSGDALLMGIGLNSGFGFFVVLFTMIIMIIGILADGYICEPYRDLVNSQMPDTASASVLDAVWDVVWNRQTRGKYFADLIPGHWFLNCDVDKRTIDLLPTTLKKKIEALHTESTAFATALRKLKVSVEDVLPAKGPIDMSSKHYDQLKSWLADTTQQISVLWANSLKEQVNVELPKMDSDNVQCMQLFNVYDSAFHSFCEMTLKNHNGWWLAMYLCLGLLGAMSVMSHYASRYFLRMVNYTYDGSEVESTSDDASSKGDKSTSSDSDSSIVGGKKSKNTTDSGKDQNASDAATAGGAPNVTKSDKRDDEKPEGAETAQAKDKDDLEKGQASEKKDEMKEPVGKKKLKGILDVEE